MSHADDSADEASDGLPDDLADHAGARLLAAMGDARQAALEALVAAHPQHAAALRRLAADLDRVDGVLASSYTHGALGTIGTLGAAVESLEQIGGHRVLRRLGEGAFGVVYLCAQERPVRREVAVKVVRSGAGGPETLRRFAAERQLLAALNHPTITQVFDAGELADGRPFFVMEYVDGLTLRAYCDGKRLGVRDRLRLFQDVCRGVAHAHARGIVHRDLKPANVLVVDGDAGPHPKIIDFGIAKALVPTTVGEQATEVGRVVGSPGYMSPEQASGRVDEVDARADVFSLGVMLYELLTGELPWAKGAASDTTDPPRPSTRVTTTPAGGYLPDDTRRRQRAKELRGDLDWITLKALARERGDRYPTVAAFAADVERHVLGQAVSVGPPSLSYRLRKFGRRHRTPLAVAGAATAVLAIVGVLFHVRTADAETAAERAMARATLAVERLVARAGDPRIRQAPENDVVRQVLAQDAIGFYDEWLRERPTERRLRLGRCQALLSLSSVHWMLGRMADAERAAAEAAHETEELFAQGPADLSTRGMLAESLRRWGRAVGSLGRIGEAEALLSRAVEHLEICNLPVADQPARALSGAYLELATARESLRQPAASLDAATRAVTVLEQYIDTGSAVAEAHTNVTLARVVLVRNLLAAGRLDEASQVVAAAQTGLARVTLEQQRVTARLHSTFAQVAMRRGDREAATEHLQLAVAAGDLWRRQEPARPLPGEALVEDLGTLAEMHEQGGETASADDAMQRAIGIADEMVTAFPHDVAHPARLERILARSAFRLYERRRLPALAAAEAWMQRVLAIRVALEQLGAPIPGPRGRAPTILAMIVEARGGASAATWESVAAALSVDAAGDTPGHDLDGAGWCGVARSRLRNGQPDDAATALAQAERWQQASSRPGALTCELEWLRAHIALQRGDLDTADAAAERIVDVQPSPFGWWQAADCHLAAWHRLAATAPDDALAIAQRDRAAELYRRVIDDLERQVREHPEDPQRVVPWGFASLQLALLEKAGGRADAGRELVTPALSALERIDPIAPRDRWQPEVLVRARALQAELRDGR